MHARRARAGRHRRRRSVVSAIRPASSSASSLSPLLPLPPPLPPLDVAVAAWLAAALPARSGSAELAAGRVGAAAALPRLESLGLALGPTATAGSAAAVGAEGCTFGYHAVSLRAAYEK